MFILRQVDACWNVFLLIAFKRANLNQVLIPMLTLRTFILFKETNVLYFSYIYQNKLRERKNLSKVKSDSTL